MSEIRATTITVMMSSSFDSLFLIFLNTLSLLTNNQFIKKMDIKKQCSVFALMFMKHKGKSFICIIFL